MEKIGRFKVLRRLGSGGFGEVWLGRDDVIERDVAIKIFRPKDENLIAFATSSDTEGLDVLRTRFVNEARILGSLENNHHVINVLDFGELDDGSPYYVMPYLPRSLTDLLGRDVFEVAAVEELADQDKPRSLPLDQALDYLEQILQGLAGAHEQNLVHRDIKPSNIMLTEKNEIRLVDFGIAKAPDGHHSTVSQLGMGSRNYMAPEQRQSAKHVDASADIYAVGCVAYRMITGRLPEGRFADPNVSAPGLGQPLNDLIVQCLSQDKLDRPSDAGALLGSFQHKRTQQSEDVESTGTWITPTDSSIRNELKPLSDKITQLLLDHGEIPKDEQTNLETIAAIADLDSQGLASLIESITHENISQISPVKNFLRILSDACESGMDDATLQALYAGGDAIGWEVNKVDAAIASRTTVQNRKAPERPADKKVQVNPVANVTNPKWKKASAIGAVVAIIIVAVVGTLLYVNAQQEEQEAMLAQQRLNQAQKLQESEWAAVLEENTIDGYLTYIRSGSAPVSRKEMAVTELKKLRVDLKKAQEIEGNQLAADKIEADKKAYENLLVEKLTRAIYEKSKKVEFGCIDGNCQNGSGVYKHTNGFYTGGFKSGLRSGQGTYIWNSGEYFSGLWKGGKKDGQGTNYTSKGYVSRSGLWRDNVFVK